MKVTVETQEPKRAGAELPAIALTTLGSGLLVIGALLSFTGALLALWLVREREIEREPVEPQLEPDPEPVAEVAPA